MTKAKDTRIAAKLHAVSWLTGHPIMPDKPTKSTNMSTHCAQHTMLYTETVPVHSAENLTRGGATAHIRLQDQTYILRITRAGKLILTK